jgi:prepilin-type N-terminal cleavage/methylation domain-containing protein
MANPQSEIYNPKSRGFTLIEIVMTIVLLTILSAIAAVIILQGVRGYTSEKSRSDVHYQARLAVERMAREIRQVRSQTIADITTMNAANFNFTDINGSQLGFRLNTGNIERTQDNSATWQTLAAGVTSLTYSYFQQDTITAATASTLWLVVISVNDTRGSETLQIRTQVHPRNF